MIMAKRRGRLLTSGGRMMPALSGIAVLVAAALHLPDAAAQETEQEDNILVEAAAGDDEAAQQDYSVPITRAGTKMNLTARDIPQSVSVIGQPRMQDQQMQTLGDVLKNTTGVTEKVADFDRSTFYSRGFLIDNYMVDDIPTVFEERWNLGDSASDTALYERIEVVRGATGLMTGAGNPSAAVNMVRKHADSREFTGNVSASYGSWNKQRYVLDLSAPLTASGNVRGRMVAGYQDNDSYIDRYSANKKFIYGVVDADLTDSTTLSAGYEYQETNADNPPWGGVPRWYRDGGKTDYSRSFNTAPDWAYNDKQSRKLFATLKQRFDNGWQFTLNGTHTETKLDSKMLYIDGFFDRDSGIGVSSYPNYPVVGGTGYNTGTRKVHAIDAFASGPYQLFGRQHQLMAGVSYSRQTNRYLNAFANLSPDDVGNFNHWNSQFPETDWGEMSVAQQDTIHQKSAYAATRFSLADSLHLIAGARYTQWSTSTLTQNMEKNNVTPYAGLVYDINDSWSAYASYTSVFKPQAYRDSSGSYLSPVTGKNYEAGVKSDWLSSRLTTSLAIFRIEQDNVAQSTGHVIPGTAETAYSPAQGTVSKGIEFEVNGAVTDNLQMTFGATRYVAEDSKGEAVNPMLPRTSVKLFAAYNPPALRELTVGGGVNWQTHTWQDVAGPEGNGTLHAEQGSYALVNLFGRYQLTKQLSLQANLNNLFDKRYDTSVSQYVVYGAPRNVSVTANYRF
ncbi:ferric-rhodotorulic acid/ferric-coprogen receptor FhuE [Serratia rhizosphaerae]|uniref:ferric-rhodotorulic acid/ferric-coprogen receptor FhuE n=1 Tax=Serratia rhizosphaerae TaxID=2597702 RepID=UPI002DB62E1C|nr:ferric-rhodotorulic acid/ferric-coprogen receptor FhuE [Serratia rhizosphaerae]MEB6338121.1 ferric-rhodotorulic acid/ferric-coprogen receptor FhuE [Serratia rhizosphaerae]